MSIPLQSTEPLSTSIPKIITSPELSSSAVISWHNAIGATLSSTVTIASQSAELPSSSITVKVTIFAPTSDISNSVSEADKIRSPQKSVLPPSISDATIVSIQSSNSTVISWHDAVGKSEIVIIDWQVEVLL